MSTPRTRYYPRALATDFPTDRPAPEFPSDERRRPRREDHYVLEDLPPNERMLWGALAYVFFPAALYRARWDPFVRFHIRQAWGLLALWIFRGSLAWPGDNPVSRAVLGFENLLERARPRRLAKAAP